MASNKQLPRPEERAMKNSTQRGFSLIELMIVVAIVAILAGIAYPAYTSQIIKGRRAQGRTALTELLQQQERYLTQRNTYLGFTTDAAGATTPAGVPFKVWSGDSQANSSYGLSAGLCPDGAGGSLAITECVQVIATQIATTDTQVGNLTLTSTGNKGCTGTTSSTPFQICWK